MDREAWRAAVHGVAKSRTRVQRVGHDWATELNWRTVGFSAGTVWTMSIGRGSVSLKSLSEGCRWSDLIILSLAVLFLEQWHWRSREFWRGTWSGYTGTLWELWVPYDGVSGAEVWEKGPGQNTRSFVIPPPKFMWTISRWRLYLGSYERDLWLVKVVVPGKKSDSLHWPSK